jgi:hypothetical protein
MKENEMDQACRLNGTAEINTKLVAYRNTSRKNHKHDDYFGHVHHRKFSETECLGNLICFCRHAAGKEGSYSVGPFEQS